MDILSAFAQNNLILLLLHSNSCYQVAHLRAKSIIQMELLILFSQYTHAHNLLKFFYHFQANEVDHPIQAARLQQFQIYLPFLHSQLLCICTPLFKLRILSHQPVYKLSLVLNINLEWNLILYLSYLCY